MLFVWLGLGLGLIDSTALPRPNHAPLTHDASQFVSVLDEGHALPKWPNGSICLVLFRPQSLVELSGVSLEVLFGGHLIEATHGRSRICCRAPRLNESPYLGFKQFNDCDVERCSQCIDHRQGRVGDAGLNSAHVRAEHPHPLGQLLLIESAFGSEVSDPLSEKLLGVCSFHHPIVCVVHSLVHTLIRTSCGSSF